MMDIKKLQRTKPAKPNTNIRSVRLTLDEITYLEKNNIVFSKLVHESIRLLKKEKVTK